MKRHEMIDALVSKDIERFFDRDDAEEYLDYLLRVGLIGYDSMTDQEIRDEYYDSFGIEL